MNAGGGGALLVCSLGPFRLRGRPLAIGLPLPTVLAVQGCESFVALPSTPPVIGQAAYAEAPVPVLSPLAALGLPEPSGARWMGSAGRRPKLVVVRGGDGEPLALRVAAALGIEHWLHQASPDLLAPLASPAITGTIVRRERWTAVLDPARLAATAETDPYSDT
jgi:chemotaxis signal transduction protein